MRSDLTTITQLHLQEKNTFINISVISCSGDKKKLKKTKNKKNRHKNNCHQVGS